MHEFEGSSDEGGSERGAERPETQAAQRPTAFSGASPLTLSLPVSPSLLRGWLDHDAGGGVQRGRSSLLIIIIVRRAWRRLDRSLALVDGGLLLF